MPFQIIRDDITKVKADAIVNTANPKPVYAAGTDVAIYMAAGADVLLAERKKIGVIERGDVAVTPAFALKAKYIIHTVGPFWEDGKHGEFDILRSCYMKSLTKAAELGCESIAFPLIATGVYGFPKDQALQIAMNEISAFLMREDTEMTVKLVVFDERAFRLSKNIFFQVESFIDDEELRKVHEQEYAYGDVYGNAYPNDIRRLERYEQAARKREIELERHHIQMKSKKQLAEIDTSKFMKDPSEDCAFQKHLLKILNEKGVDNATVYKRANVTKGAFSKIICGDTKKPQKKTVLGLCVALKLDLTECAQMLAAADLAFNPYSKRDQLVIQFIERDMYDVDEINLALFACGQTLLGS